MGLLIQFVLANFSYISTPYLQTSLQSSSLLSSLYRRVSSPLPPMCFSFPSVRHIPQSGQQLHPNLPCATLQRRQARRGEANADTRPGLRASLGGVRTSRAAATTEHRAARLNEEGAGQLLLGRAFPPVWLLPNSVDHWEQKTIGSSLPVAYFKSAGLYVTAANLCYVCSRHETEELLPKTFSTYILFCVFV